MLILEADQHVAGVKSKHHGQRGPALLPFQPGERGASIGQQVSEHAAHRGVGWVLLHDLDQAGKVGGDLFFVHFRYSITQKITRIAGNPRQYWQAEGLQIRCGL